MGVIFLFTEWKHVTLTLAVTLLLLKQVSLVCRSKFHSIVMVYVCRKVILPHVSTDILLNAISLSEISMPRVLSWCLWSS